MFQNRPKRLFRHFSENFDQKKSLFSARAPPSKIVLFAFRNILRLFTKNECRKYIPKGDPLEKFGNQN